MGTNVSLHLSLRNSAGVFDVGEEGEKKFSHSGGKRSSDAMAKSKRKCSVLEGKFPS